MQQLALFTFFRKAAIVFCGYVIGGNEAKTVVRFKMRAIVRNLRYKLLFIIFLAIVGVQTVSGDINASKYYADYAREFLGYFGHINPFAVPIRKMSKNDKRYATAAGYANGSSICLNEDFFAKRHRLEGANLFTCAHEAAHYVFGHPYQENRSILEREKEADICAADMLCKHGYKWILKQEILKLKQLIDAEKGSWTDGEHPTLQQQYNYLSKILEVNREGSPYRACMEELRGLLREISSLSREKKLVIAGTLTMGFMGWL